MGGGGRTVTYKQPEPDRSFEKYLEYEMRKDREADARRKADEEAARIKEEKRRAGARTNAGAFYNSLESQLRGGLISYADASSQLQGYGSRYDLAPGFTSKFENKLSDVYQTDIRKGRRTTGVDYAYSEILGREATAAEKKKAMAGFNNGYFATVDDFKDSLYKSAEYKKKNNDSYLENYYDTMYGDQERNKKGELTGKRTFKYNENYMPTFQGDLEGTTGIKMPGFGDFTGTVSEIEENIQSMRSARQFLYSAGLTNLQGEIDQEVQKLKNQGTKDIANISKESNILGNLVSSFNFSA